jgi:hypothetical protein
MRSRRLCVSVRVLLSPSCFVGSWHGPHPRDGTRIDWSFWWVRPTPRLTFHHVMRGRVRRTPLVRSGATNLALTRRARQRLPYPAYMRAERVCAPSWPKRGPQITLRDLRRPNIVSGPCFGDFLGLDGWPKGRYSGTPISVPDVRIIWNLSL